MWVVFLFPNFEPYFHGRQARGLAQAELLLAAAPGGLWAEAAARAALAAGESMLAFGFAAVALEAALQRGLVLPFGDRE